MRKACFLITFFFTFLCVGQTSNWDKLSSKLSSYKNQDTIRLQALLDATRYYEVRNVKENLILFKEADSLSKMLNLPKYKGRLLLAKARNKILEGIYIDAVDKLFEAIPLLEEASDSYHLRNAVIVQAEIDRENDNFTKAIDNIKKAISEVNPEKEPFQLAELYFTLGNVYLNLHEDERYKLSVPILEKSKALFTQINNNTGIGLVNTRLARFYKIASREFDREINHNNAMRLAEEALTLFKDHEQTANEAYAYYSMATSKSIIGDHVASIPLYHKSLKKYEEVGNLVYSMRIYQHLFVAYSITKQQKKAMEMNHGFVTNKDSIFSLEKRKLITEAQTKFDTAKIQADKEKAELRERQNMSYFIGAAIIGLLILLASLFLLGNVKQRKKAEIITLELQETQKRLALEKQYRDSELKALKAQMNPHFIFNALNSIQEYIILNQKNLASEYLGKFADLMRKYLHFSDAGGISIEDEVSCLKMYLELEKLRFEDQLQYTINVSEEINQGAFIIPTMIIQPYVENALKHGLLHLHEERKLSVNFSSINKKTILCVVEDNGIGREASAQKKQKKGKHHRSFATKATANRLDLLNHGKTQKIGVVYEDLINKDASAAGTKVTLTIPFINKVL